VLLFTNVVQDILHMNIKIIFSAMSAVMVAGCATMATPENAPQSLYAAQQQSRATLYDTPICRAAPSPVEIAGLEEVGAAAFASAPDQLSQGDRLRLTVTGDKDRLTGTYVVAADGTIMLGNMLRIDAAGKSIEELEREISGQLLAAHYIRPLSGGVSLQPVELSGIAIAVSGAVFEPGVVRIGERQPETRSVNLSNIVSGDQNIARTLTTALRAAGGVRPDADPRMVFLLRGGQYSRIDLTGAVDGTRYSDVSVAAGDRIIVGSVGCLQPALVRPSPITAPGIRVFFSNLSRPASNNASSAIGRETTSLPYGTRFLQGLVAANCVGGSAMNAGRSAVLISRNPVNGQSIVISRSIERLVREADRDSYDPYLLPGDSIACYDSVSMNLRDVLSVVGETTSPYLLFRAASGK
jgi:polysaccharide biosynthesis/export protein